MALTDVPPGTYHVVCWHEGMKATPVSHPDAPRVHYRYDGPTVLTKEVEVKPKGTAKLEFEFPAPE